MNNKKNLDKDKNKKFKVNNVKKNSGKKAKIIIKEAQDVVLQSYNLLDKEALHEELIFKFGFPDYYGRNLDALNDMLTSWTSPLLIVLFGEKELLKTLGDYGKSFVSILKNASVENSNIFFYSEDRRGKMKLRKD